MCRKINHYLIILVLVFLSACESLPPRPGGPDNPLDPNNPNYVLPYTTLLSGPQANDIVSSDEVTFSWQGNQDGMLFRTRLDDKNWSAYAAETSVTLTDLDEYDHTFYIQGQYATGVESESDSVFFVVDAVEGPALILMPGIIEINSGSQFYIELWIDESDSIAGLSTTILFDPDKVNLVRLDFFEDNEESFLLKNGGELITFSDIDNENGSLDIDCAVVTGYPRNVFGNGKIAGIIFNHISTSGTIISISSNSMIRNDSNQNITINNFKNAEILIK